MFPEPVKIVFVQYFIQALLALVIVLILKKFFRRYKNDFYLLWSWSWLALFLNMFGSLFSLANAFLLPLDNLFRLLVSVITVSASFIQLLLLYSGSLELSKAKKMNRKTIKVISALIVPISILLVFLFYADPDAGNFRIFYRVGIRSLLGGLVFISCAFLLKRISNVGIGIRFIIFSFLAYGILQFNYFLEVFLELQGINYPIEVPYFMGSLDIFLQAVMGLGMIISVLEIEQYNLKKANTELDTFLYRSSHDLRAPLTTISGIVSAIRMTDDPNQKEEFLSAIQGKLEQADNVIRDIIALRNGQKADLVIAEVNLKEELINQFNSLVDPNTKSPKLTFLNEELGVINTDKARLQTILTNLLSNAIKYHNYNQPIPSIQIEIKCDVKGIDLTIRDNGPGIDKRHLSRIFDMFYRASKESNGTGLGLYLVKDALAHIGGDIKVWSEKGRGTTFTIYLVDHGPNHSSN